MRKYRSGLIGVSVCKDSKSINSKSDRIYSIVDEDIFFERRNGTFLAVMRQWWLNLKSKKYLNKSKTKLDY